MASESYAGRVALVTGASSGIGERLARDFAERGAHVALVARRADRLAAVAEACAERGVEAEALVGDLADRSFTRALVGRVVERFGRLDFLINNAGIPKHKQIYDVTADDVDRTLEINCLAPVHLTLDALCPMLRQGGGFVVNVSSAAGRIPPPRETIYATSKFALTGFSKGLAVDLDGSNVHVAVIHVGAIDTEIWDKAAAEAPMRFRGHKHPPSVVSRAVFRCIERRRHEATVPRWLWWIFLLELLIPGPLRRGTARYDPVPPEVIERARQMARSRPSQ